MADDIFDRLNPKDGFHIVEVDTGVSLSLHCQAYGNGELYNLTDPKNPDVATVQLAEWMGPGLAARGACTRLWLVLDAVARYLTTGGSWEELTGAMRGMAKVAVSGMAYNGYILSDSYQTVDGYQHVFVKDDESGEAVLWDEPAYTETGGLIGGFIDRTTVAEIRRQQDADWGDSEEEAGEAEDEAGEADSVPVPGDGNPARQGIAG